MTGNRRPEPKKHGTPPMRRIPAVHSLLETGELPRLQCLYGRRVIKQAALSTLDRLRAEVRNGAIAGEGLDPEVIAERVAAQVKNQQVPSLRRVVNATGVVLHTNLGRAVLAEEARQAVFEVGGCFSTLELDLETGGRGSRQSHVVELLNRLTGAPSGLVLNNNAAGVLLALSALAGGREVIVSRGELVEIGGSFRIPEVMIQSGARLVEVGTTNKTRIDDYAMAITTETAILLKVHPSNYRIQGFTEDVPLADLVKLGRREDIPVMYDLGSGSLLFLDRWGIKGEPSVADAVQSGADVIAFSGDKLLGGPQAGILLGRESLIERCRKHPLMRALRMDKLTLTALEATLRLYTDEDLAIQSVPTLRMLSMNPAELAGLAGALRRRLRHRLGAAAAVECLAGTSRAGGGSLPGADLPTTLVAVTPGDISPEDLATRLRAAFPPVLARINDNKLLLDPRTLLPGDDVVLVEALGHILSPEAE